MRSALRLSLIGVCWLVLLTRVTGGEEAAPAPIVPAAASVPDDQLQRAQTPAPPPGPQPAARSPVRPVAPPSNPPATPVPPSPTTGLSLAPNPFGAIPTFGPSTVPAAPSAGLTSLSSFSDAGIPQMLGDLAPMSGAPKGAIKFPWVRGYKMADNQSPRPQDRVYVAFNFYDNLRQSPTSSLREVKVYREFFGFEKTFFDGNASIGLRLPLNTLSVASDQPGVGGASTALGDLTIILKGILLQNREAGCLISSGLAVTAPSGPANFAGAPFARSITTTSFQPFIGYLWNPGRWFLQGFTGTNVPTDPRVVTMYYNDVGVGYSLFRARDPDAWIAAVVPTFEVHINTPLNHRVTQVVGSLAGTPDVVDLTFGSSVVLRGGSSLSAGIVNPVTGPRPYDFEVVLLLNVLFGRRRPSPPTPPPLL